jgi:hypothetical protein
MRRGGAGKRRDVNEGDIVAALKAFGATVFQLNGSAVPDLLVGFRGRWLPLEVKTKTGRFTRLQADGFVNGGATVPVVRSVDEALRAVGITVTERP